MKGPRIATNKNSSVIPVPIADTGLPNSWRKNNARRRHQVGTTPRALVEDFDIDVTIIGWSGEPLRGLNVREMVSFESLKIYR